MYAVLSGIVKDFSESIQNTTQFFANIYRRSDVSKNV